MSTQVMTAKDTRKCTGRALYNLPYGVPGYGALLPLFYWSSIKPTARENIDSQICRRIILSVAYIFILFIFIALRIIRKRNPAAAYAASA